MDPLLILALVAGLALAVGSTGLAVALGVAIRLGRLEARTSHQVEGLPIGATVPERALRQLLPADELARWLDGPSVVAFVSPTCQPCRELVGHLNEQPKGSIPQRLLFIEPSLETTHSLQELSTFPARWVEDGSRQLRRSFASSATPHGFLIVKGLIADQRLGSDMDSLFEAGLAVAGEAHP